MGLGQCKYTHYNISMALAWAEWCLGHDYCHEKCPKLGYERCFSELIIDWERHNEYMKIERMLNNGQKREQQI